ncbi:MAG: hypothetical protein JJT96_00245 [Opitutales bacterium]|nr:hypothetical protein [Opitutales bacterium]
MQILASKEIWERARAGWERLSEGQCLAEGDENYGAFLDANGVPIPGHVGTALLVAGLVFEGVVREDFVEARCARIGAALRWFEESALNENGRISSPDCNPDSGPDTAFVVQLWCGLLDGVGRSGEVSGAWAELIGLMHKLLRRMLQGLPGAGFHTPNHRWVMATALAWGFRETGDAALRRELDLYLAEGPDGDAEGFYPERSAGVYDAVSNRAFQLLHRWAGWAEGLGDVRRNLELINRLLNSDGTVDTVLSTRQDANAAVVPDCLLDVLLRAHRAGGEPVESDALKTLFATIWEAAPELSVSAALWLAWEVRCSAPVECPALAGAVDGEWFVRSKSVWRARCAGWSFRAMAGHAYPLVLRSPVGEEFRMALAHAYMGTGAFRGDRFLERSGTAWALRHEARGVAFRPGYEMPLGIRVEAENYEARRSDRPLRAFAPAASVLSWKWTRTGSELCWASEYEAPGVYAQWVVDVPAGMFFEIGGAASRVAPGEVRFFGDGASVAWSGEGWRLECGSGCVAHRMHPMRDALAPPPDGGRFVIALRTPFTHRLTLRFR